MQTASPHRFRDNLRRNGFFWLLVVLCGAVLAGLSIARYVGYNAGMLDLGNMAQAIASVVRGDPLITTTPNGNVSRLAGHAEIIYFLLAVPYMLWPDPRLLLGIQAGLFALGALPVYWMSIRRLGEDRRAWALCLVLIYLLYPVAQTAVLFDLHGDTLAMPLLLFALDALDRRAWRRYALFIGLALLCKVYVALAVAGIGVYALWWGGQRRVGLLTLGVALFYGMGVFFGLRPLFAPQAGAGTGTETLQGYLAFYFGRFAEVWATAPLRFFTAIIVVGPALFLAWRGWRWLLVGAPILAGVLLTSGPGGASDYRYHHYAMFVPFLLMAAIDGAGRLKTLSERQRAELQNTCRTAGGQRGSDELRSSSPATVQGLQATPAGRRQAKLHRNWRGDLLFATGIVLVCNAILVDTPLNPAFWQAAAGNGLDPSRYGVTDRDAVKDRFLAEYVPPQAPLAASMFIGPHLADREIVYSVRYPDDPGGERLPQLLPRVDYILADALFDYRRGSTYDFVAGATYERAEISYLLRHPEVGLVAARDGLLLFRRGDSAATFAQQIGRETAPETQQPLAQFADIDLLTAAITPLGGRRYQATFNWRASGPPGDYVAVSRLSGVADTRIVHLPTYALLPTTEWQPGELVRETFEFALPADLVPGTYTWQTAWYDLRHSEAYATDARSLAAGSGVVDVLTVVVE